MPRIPLTLPDDMYDTLRKLSFDTHKPMAKHIRSAITEYLNKKEEVKMQTLGNLTLNQIAELEKSMEEGLTKLSTNNEEWAIEVNYSFNLNQHKEISDNVTVSVIPYVSDARQGKYKFNFSSSVTALMSELCETIYQVTQLPEQAKRIIKESALAIKYIAQAKPLTTKEEPPVKCKSCGTEIKSTEFDQFFTEESLNDRLCPECAEKARAERKRLSDEEVAAHPEWHGPANQDECF